MKRPVITTIALIKTLYTTGFHAKFALFWLTFAILLNLCAFKIISHEAGLYAFVSYSAICTLIMNSQASFIDTSKSLFRKLGL